MVEDGFISPSGMFNKLSDSSCYRLKSLSGFECRQSPYFIAFIVTPKAIFPLAYQGAIGFDLFLKGPVKVDSVIHRINTFLDTTFDSKVIRKVQWHGIPYYLADFPNANISPFENESTTYLEKIGLFSYKTYSGNHGIGITKTIKLLKFDGQEVVLSE